MIEYSLNGDWKLYWLRQKDRRADFSLLKNAKAIDAVVPGNVELDLSRAGILPEDLYMGLNINKVQKFEGCEWWYEKKFSAPKGSGPKILHFEAVDCFAQYFLNGEIIGESDNMFIPFDFDITDKIRNENTLHVRIRSAVFEGAAYDYSVLPMFINAPHHADFEAVPVRKAPHSYGWDIMPRAVSAGIWRGVSLRVKEECEFSQLHYFVSELSGGAATVNFAAELDLAAPIDGDYSLEIEGVCGESRFRALERIHFKCAAISAKIENPRLWWPYGYGEPNLYACKARVFRGDVLICEKSFSAGLRTVKLIRRDRLSGEGGEFCFLINGVKVFCRGANWVPMDAFHSRDVKRYEKALELASEIGCNILRCWGGNVYEDTHFYDICDRKGIMVWQDFSMACSFYPQTEAFAKRLAKEATSVVRKLRAHPSIILWSGDNECDDVYFRKGLDPNDNILTRRILPEVVRLNDFGRPYLPSSPYISREVFAAGDRSLMPEEHLWGARDYYKSGFYKDNPANFVSETGYHGCPNEDSIKKFITSEKLFPYENNEEWILHSSSQNGDGGRVMLMHRQIEQLFGGVPRSLGEFALASQISQAEAKKFFIENMRVKKPRTSGIIWWNLIDGWPQFSDAVVDYYYEKKLAFDYIKRSQAPFAIIISEIEAWNLRAHACNDTLGEVSGIYEISDIDTGEVLGGGKFFAGKNSRAELCKIPMMYSAQKMLLIKWEAGAHTGCNHYLCGMPPFSFDKYRHWLEKMKEAMG